MFLGLEPLDLHLERNPISAFIRLNPSETWSGIGKGKKRGTIFNYNKKLTEMGLPKTIEDKNTEGPCFGRGFNISMTPTARFVNTTDTAVGTLSAERTADVHIWKYTLKCSTETHSAMRTTCSGSDETSAICEAASKLLEVINTYKCKLIYIISDSAIFVNALKSQNPKKGSVRNCWLELQTLSGQAVVNVSFCSAKEKAAAAWKNLWDERPLETLPRTQSGQMSAQHIANILEARYTEGWNTRWTSVTNCRQARRFWPQVDLTTSRRLVQFDRTTLSKTIQIISGHGFNRYHQHLAGLIEDDECRFCMEDIEDTWHVINECPALVECRKCLTSPHGEEQVPSLKFPQDIPRLRRSFMDISSLFCPEFGA